MHGAAVRNFNVVPSNDQDEEDELEILAKWWLDRVHLCPRCEGHVCRNDADNIAAHQRRCPGGSGGDRPAVGGGGGNHPPLVVVMAVAVLVLLSGCEFYGRRRRR